MTLLNYWHYIVLLSILLLFIVGTIGALRQSNKKLAYSMVFSIALISIFLAALSVVIVDKYTKKVELSKLQNRRLLSTEEISYWGIVTNTGNFPIGKVTFEIKLVNKGHAIGNVKGGDFYKPNGIMAFFSGGFGISNKPQTITKKFVVAKNLKAGHAKMFRVYFKYPPYFSSVSEFAKVYGH